MDRVKITGSCKTPSKERKEGNEETETPDIAAICGGFVDTNK
jgi:hypothetical protein